MCKSTKKRLDSMRVAYKKSINYDFFNITTENLIFGITHIYIILYLFLKLLVASLYNTFKFG